MSSFTPNPTFTLDAEQERLWSNAIGGLILNFGMIEFQSHRWIQHFASDPVLGDFAIEMPFSRRLQLILELVNRSELSSATKQRAVDLWKETGAISTTRNTVAHNPLVFSRTPDGQMAFGIPNVRRMKGKGPFSVEALQIGKIIESALRLAEIAKEFDSLITSGQDSAQ